MSLPWKITHKKTLIESNGIELEVIDYGCLLVGELEYLKSLPKDISNDELGKTFVAYCLRLRYELDGDVTDEQILEGMPIDLVGKLFNFFIGRDGIAEVSDKPKKPKKLTGERPTGNFSSTTQDTPILQTRPVTNGVRSKSSQLLSKPKRMSA